MTGPHHEESLLAHAPRRANAAKPAEKGTVKKAKSTASAKTSSSNGDNNHENIAHKHKTTNSAASNNSKNASKKGGTTEGRKKASVTKSEPLVSSKKAGGNTSIDGSYTSDSKSKRSLHNERAPTKKRSSPDVESAPPAEATASYQEDHDHNEQSRTTRTDQPFEGYLATRIRAIKSDYVDREPHQQVKLEYQHVDPFEYVFDNLVMDGFQAASGGKGQQAPDIDNTLEDGPQIAGRNDIEQVPGVNNISADGFQEDSGDDKQQALKVPYRLVAKRNEDQQNSDWRNEECAEYRPDLADMDEYIDSLPPHMRPSNEREYMASRAARIQDLACSRNVELVTAKMIDKKDRLKAERRAAGERSAPAINTSNKILDPVPRWAILGSNDFTHDEVLDACRQLALAHCGGESQEKLQQFISGYQLSILSSTHKRLRINEDELSMYRNLFAHKLIAEARALRSTSDQSSIEGSKLSLSGSSMETFEDSAFGAFEPDATFSPVRESTFADSTWSYGDIGELMSLSELEDEFDDLDSSLKVDDCYEEVTAQPVSPAANSESLSAPAASTDALDNTPVRPLNCVQHLDEQGTAQGAIDDQAVAAHQDVPAGASSLTTVNTAVVKSVLGSGIDSTMTAHPGTTEPAPTPQTVPTPARPGAQAVQSILFAGEPVIHNQPQFESHDAKGLSTEQKAAETLPALPAAASHIDALRQSRAAPTAADLEAAVALQALAGSQNGSIHKQTPGRSPEVSQPGCKTQTTTQSQKIPDTTLSHVASTRVENATESQISTTKPASTPQSQASSRPDRETQVLSRTPPSGYLPHYLRGPSTPESRAGIGVGRTTPPGVAFLRSSLKLHPSLPQKPQSVSQAPKSNGKNRSSQLSNIQATLVQNSKCIVEQSQGRNHAPGLQNGGQVQAQRPSQADVSARRSGYPAMKGSPRTTQVPPSIPPTQVMANGEPKAKPNNDLVAEVKCQKSSIDLSTLRREVVAREKLRNQERHTVKSSSADSLTWGATDAPKQRDVQKKSRGAGLKFTHGRTQKQPTSQPLVSAYVSPQYQQPPQGSAMPQNPYSPPQPFQPHHYPQHTPQTPAITTGQLGEPWPTPAAYEYRPNLSSPPAFSNPGMGYQSSAKPNYNNGGHGQVDAQAAGNNRTSLPDGPMSGRSSQKRGLDAGRGEMKIYIPPAKRNKRK